MAKQRDLLESWGNLESSMQMCSRALKKEKTKDFKRLLESLDLYWLKFNADFKIYKEEILVKNNKNEDFFNAVSVGENGEETYAYKYNDKWKEIEFGKYADMRESLQDHIDVLDSTSVGDLSTQDNSLAISGNTVEQCVLDIKTEIDSIEEAVSALESDISDYADGSMNAILAAEHKCSIGRLVNIVSQDFKAVIHAKLAISQESVDPDFSNSKIEEKYRLLSIKWKGKLNSLYILIAKKTAPLPVTEPKPTVGAEDTIVTTDLVTPRYLREQVHLEKTKPPRFDGTELEFPEFKRKWLAQVNKAGLPEDSELDKLRDAVPKQAKDMLYGVNQLCEAWKILDHRYGNKDLISRKLKDQLKNIVCEGSNEPEKLMDLKIKVKNVVTRLETMGLQADLSCDREFLSAIYNAMPQRYRNKWLDLVKTEDKWSDMMKFLEDTYNKALEEISLLSTLSGSAKKVKSFGLEASSSVSQHEEKYQKAKIAAGKCPACKDHHTFKKNMGKDAGKLWPSDRFVSCRKFRDMNVQQRAQALQTAQGCPRCTSWGHKRSDCKAKPNSCGEMVGGIKCQADHSKLVHGSGNIYCAALSTKHCGVSTKADRVKVQHLVTKQSSSSLFDSVNELEKALYYIQDIPVRNCASARVFWDRGSNRVLIREAYAVTNQLPSHKVVYQIKTVGNELKQISGNIYVVDLLDINGQVKTVWGYGVPSIMEYSHPDILHLHYLFPHVHTDAFKALASAEVDILVGLNYNEIHPDCELVDRDKVGGLTVLKSNFGCGWIVGGHHRQITDSCEISPEAAVARIAKVQIIPQPSLTPEFWESENMGVLPPPRCDTCLGCMKTGTCSERYQILSTKQQAELDLIRSKMRLEKGEVWCGYPYVKNPACLSDNRRAVERVAVKVERGLIKDGLHDVYNKEILSQLERGVAVKLSDKEMEDWCGPFQYITHHAVLKDSKTTPVRVVTNSSFNNAGSSLNSCIARGPNSLNPMLHVMLMPSL